MRNLSVGSMQKNVPEKRIPGTFFLFKFFLLEYADDEQGCDN